MRNGIRWIGRIHLRIERGDFHRKIYNRKKLQNFFDRIGPTSRFPGEAIKQIKTALSILVSFLFAHDGFAQKIDGETDFSRAALAQRFHYIFAIFSGDKLSRHSGNVASQDECADPRHDPRDSDTAPNDRREAVTHTTEISLERLHDLTQLPKQRQHLHKA